VSERLVALARRVRNDPFFLASVLHEYARSEGLEEADLAAMLACPVEMLATLSLCRRPRPEPPLFRHDVELIATRFGVRAEVLASIVRHVDALTSMRRDAAVERGFLMAARDDDEPAESEERS